MKKLLLMPLLALFAFASCSDDKDDNGKKPEVTKLVKSFTLSYNDEVWESTTFEYDNQNRITRIAEYDGDIINVTYSGSTITCNWNDGSVGVITIDNNDMVLESKFDDYNYTYEYSNGYISKVTCDKLEDVYTYKWQNGNLAEVGNIYDSADKFTYTNYPNKVNILVLNEDVIDPIYGMEYLSFKGMTSANLPLTWDAWYTDEIFTYVYTMDDDGYPTQTIAKSAKGNQYKTVYTYYE